MARSSELAMYCGLGTETGSPQPVTSSGHIASVHFHTDYSISGTPAAGVHGFMITWSEVQGMKFILIIIVFTCRKQLCISPFQPHLSSKLETKVLHFFQAFQVVVDFIQNQEQNFHLLNTQKHISIIWIASG